MSACWSFRVSVLGDKVQKRAYSHSARRTAASASAKVGRSLIYQAACRTDSLRRSFWRWASNVTSENSPSRAGVVRAIAGLALHPEAVGRVFNIGSTEETTIRQLAERVKALTLTRSPIVPVPYEEAYGPGFEDMARRVPDTSRIFSLLGWQPRYRLEDTLGEIVGAWRAREVKSLEPECAVI